MRGEEPPPRKERRKSRRQGKRGGRAAAKEREEEEPPPGKERRRSRRQERGAAAKESEERSRRQGKRGEEPPRKQGGEEAAKEIGRVPVDFSVNVAISCPTAKIGCSDFSLPHQQEQFTSCFDFIACQWTANVVSVSVLFFSQLPSTCQDKQGLGVIAVNGN